MDTLDNIKDLTLQEKAKYAMPQELRDYFLNGGSSVYVVKIIEMLNEGLSSGDVPNGKYLEIDREMAKVSDNDLTAPEERQRLRKERAWARDITADAQILIEERRKREKQEDPYIASYRDNGD